MVLEGGAVVRKEVVQRHPLGASQDLVVQLHGVARRLGAVRWRRITVGERRGRGKESGEKYGGAKRRGVDDASWSGYFGTLSISWESF